MREQGDAAHVNTTKTVSCTIDPRPVGCSRARRVRLYIVLLSLLHACRSSAQERATPPPRWQEEPASERTLSLDSLGSDEEREALPDRSKLTREIAAASNLRFTLDLSSRISLSTRSGKVGAEHVIGLDLHKVFSDADGDWGTLRLQPYFTRIDNLSPRSPFLEDDDDWELVFRFFDFNFTRIARGRFNIRVGHFEVPYGLEHLLDTNGTVRQFIPGRNIGLKADWGISINGVFPQFEYEVALTRGTGNEFFDRGDPFAVSGRIGTPRDRNVVLGLSAFHGRVWNPGAVRQWRSGLKPLSKAQTARGVTETGGGRGRDDIVRRTRFGVDAQWYLGTVGLLAEASYGRDYHQDVFNGLAEINWNNADDKWFVYTQARVFAQRFARGWDSAVQSVVGMRYRPDNHWSFSVQYLQNIDSMFDARRDTILTVQTRYRF